jgi:hypothetical protein
MIYIERCQRQNEIGDISWAHRARARVAGGLGIRSGIRRAIATWKTGPGARLGLLSRYSPGNWIRVLDTERIQQTLGTGSSLRGLKFVGQQWAYCGGVYQVQRVVRRIVDDDGRMRPVSSTITLEGVGCGGVDATAGCGRDCPLFFRDEWVEPVAAPAAGPEGDRCSARYVEVRSQEEIESTLDSRGKRQSLMFMPEMLRYTKMRFPILKRVTNVYEADRHAEVRIPIYILDGLYCSGAVMGARGPCDRGCRLLWHADWLRESPE